MGKILIRDNVYQSVSSTSFFENEYEDLILGIAPKLFPEYIVVPFKMAVHSERGIAKADLAFIERRYRRCWVVEVELAHHSLTGHVMPQVEKLATGSYGPEVASYLVQQSASLNLAALEEMLKGAHPDVMIVVDTWISEWQSALSLYSVQVAVIEVFRSERNEHVFRLNGSYPTAFGSTVSLLRPEKSMPRLMIVESPAALETGADGRLVLEFNGQTTEWTKISIADRVWLAPIRESPLSTNQAYALIKTDDGRLTIRPIHKKGEPWESN
jgi:hypothetical protein